MGRKPQIIKKNRVKELLDGRSQMWLVRKTGISKDRVNKIANNNKNMHKAEIRKLTKFFEVTEDELYSKEGKL